MPESLHSRSEMAPDVDVLSTSAPTACQRLTTSCFGNPQRLAWPADTIASDGRNAFTNGALDDVRLP